jgi:hypothetical protein
MSRPHHHPWFDHHNNIRWRNRLWSSLCNFVHDPSSPVLGPNILFNTLFPKTLSLCSSLKVRDQVSHLYSTTGKITFFLSYSILLLISLGVKRPGREADHSSPSSAEFKNAWSYTSTPPIRLYGVVLS